MKIDGVEVEEGSTVLFVPQPSRWLRFTNWCRRKLGMEEKRPAPNGLYRVTTGSWDGDAKDKN